MKNILVAGAHGTTGQKIVDLLKKDDNYEPIAMVRVKDQVPFFDRQNVKAIVADLEGELSETVKNVDKVIFAAGSGGKKVVEVDQRGAERLIDASKKAGVRKFVLLSSIGAGHPEKADRLKEYLQAKHHADQHLRNSGLPFTIVRPGTLNNHEGTGKIKLAEELESHGNIPREDVAATLVAALHDNVAPDAIFEVVSGEVAIPKALDGLS